MQYRKKPDIQSNLWYVVVLGKNGENMTTLENLYYGNVSTTLNIYTHAVRKAKAKAANVMAGLIDENDQ